MRMLAAIAVLAVVLASWSANAVSFVGDRIVRVIDGDTFVLSGEDDRAGLGEPVKVRVWGISAPELSTERGRKSKELFERLVEFLDRQGVYSIVCTYKGGSYDRIVGQCTVMMGQRFFELNGRTMIDLGALLVRIGVARDCPAYSGGYYADDENERSADIELPSYCTAGRRDT